MDDWRGEHLIRVPVHDTEHYARERKKVRKAEKALALAGGKVYRRRRAKPKFGKGGVNGKSG